MKREKSARRQVLGSIGSALVLVVLIVLSVVLILNRDSLSIDNITRALSYRNLGSAEQAEEFQFSDHSTNTFAVLGDGIAVASAGGLSYYDKTGENIYADVFPMDRPVISAVGDLVLAYDQSGTAIRVGDRQGVLHNLELTNQERSGAIIDARLNEDGWVTICTDEIGTRGRVTVVNPDGNDAYRVNVRSGYLLGAALASDNKTLVILTVTESGGRVMWYTTDSEDNEPVYEYLCEDELLYDLWFTDRGAVAVMSSSQVVYLSARGEYQDAYSFAGSYLRDYTLDGGEAVLYISPYQNSRGGTLVHLPVDGEPTEIEVEGSIADMSLSGRYLAVLFTDSLSLYRDMEPYSQWEETDGMTRVIMREDGSILRLSSYRAKLIIP